MRIFASLLLPLYTHTHIQHIRCAVVEHYVPLKSLAISICSNSMCSEFLQQMPSSWPIIIMKHSNSHHLLITLKIHAIHVYISWTCFLFCFFFSFHSFSGINIGTTKANLPVNKRKIKSRKKNQIDYGFFSHYFIKSMLFLQ